MLSGNRDCFLCLNKALYGLRQAPRLWNQEIGFHRSHTDISLYIRNDGVLILLYVDDILVLYAEEESEKALEVKQQLMLKYKMSNLGPAKQFLGLEIDRLADGTITLRQPEYIDNPHRIQYARCESGPDSTAPKEPTRYRPFGCGG